jgi:type IV pilus assembly protein PilX
MTSLTPLIPLTASTSWTPNNATSLTVGARPQPCRSGSAHSVCESAKQPIRQAWPSPLQRGVSLLIVMVLVLVGSLAVLGALRYGILGEASVGNEADFQRARAAADALIEDARIDILGYLPPDNTPCNPDEVNGGCRSSGTTPAIPLTWDDLDVLEDVISAQAGFNANFPCLIAGAAPGVNANPRRMAEPGGLCVTSTQPIGGAGAAANWWAPALPAEMLARGTPFGGATGRIPDANDPILSNPARARYWIEAIRYANRPLEPTQPSFQLKSQRAIYRVTAYAQGVRGGSVVVQSVLIHPSSQVD